MGGDDSAAGGDTTPVDQPAGTFDPTPFLTHVRQGWSITKRHLLWTLFPLAVGLLVALPVVEALGHGEVAVYPVGSFPGPIVDLWTIVVVPTGGMSVVLRPGATAMLTLPTVVTGLFAGAYLGSVNDLLEHRRPSLWRNGRRFGVPIALYTVLWGAVTATITAVLSVSLWAGTVAGLGFLFVTYRLWATPYLVVARDATLPAAFRQAWQLSSSSGRYLGYSFYVLTTTLILAAPRIYGVRIGSVAGLVGSTLFLAPIATMVTVASLGFVRSLDAEV